MAKRQYIVRVKFPERAQFDHNMMACFNMLSYAGKVDRDVFNESFPFAFTYTTDHEPSQEVERWRSFNFKAEWEKV